MYISSFQMWSTTYSQRSISWSVSSKFMALAYESTSSLSSIYLNLLWDTCNCLTIWLCNSHPSFLSLSLLSSLPSPPSPSLPSSLLLPPFPLLSLPFLYSLPSSSPLLSLPLVHTNQSTRFTSANTYSWYKNSSQCYCEHVQRISSCSHLQIHQVILWQSYVVVSSC